jgi:hypothetical protein
LTRRLTLPSCILVSVLIGVLVVRASGDNRATASGHPSPIHLTSEQDHQRVMDFLHIRSLRRGVDGDPKSPNAANYNESKVTPYALPDPLLLKNGRRVTNAKTWWKERRPEIVENFDREIYGRAPKNTPKVNWEVTSSTKEMNGDMPVITKNLSGMWTIRLIP